MSVPPSNPEAHRAFVVGIVVGAFLMAVLVAVVLRQGCAAG